AFQRYVGSGAAGRRLGPGVRFRRHAPERRHRPPACGRPALRSFVYGERALFSNLEDYVFSILKGRSAFFYFLAQSVSRFKPPVNVFGNIITESSKHHTESIDLKNSLSSVIMFARIYALYHGIRHKNTSKRIDSLTAREVFSTPTGNELNFHFHYLMYLRMKEQINQIMHREAIGNSIEMKKLIGTEQLLLKRVFLQMNSYEEKLSAEFMSSFKG
ncbi:MAG TPA: putative nucleotidyltransferase substrate binding domain-containing protein, partial [Prolixibacteraceae bacterium]|nr:putative nucleotidyltransferase substrate binding domain-containing protein [Prolixibacteraceae bacterium]